MRYKIKQIWKNRKQTHVSLLNAEKSKTAHKKIALYFFQQKLKDLFQKLRFIWDEKDIEEDRTNVYKLLV